MIKKLALSTQFIVWRILLFLIAIPAFFILPLKDGFTNIQGQGLFQSILTMWSNFDGIYYLKIASFGHTIQGQTNEIFSFFPLFPWLIARIDIFLNNQVLSGLLLSNIAFLGALLVIRKLLLLDFQKRIVDFALILILIFPASIFFGAIYTESLLLLFSALAFYFARKKNFLYAGIFSALASATKFTGIFLWPAIIIEYYLANGKSFKKCLNLNLISLALPPIGLFSFMQFQFSKTGSSLLFLTSKANIGPIGVSDKLILLHQVFFRYSKMIIMMDHIDPLFFTILLELLVGAGFLVLLFFSFNKIRPSYWIYCLLTYLLPTFTGTFTSLPRYVAVLFPLFAFLSLFLERNHPFMRYLYILSSLILSALAISFFTRGYFIG